MVFIDDKNLINKKTFVPKVGSKAMCCQITALKFINKNV